MATREDVVNLALKQDGITVTSHKDMYVALLGPSEAPAMKQYFCDPKTSGCALVIRGIWRELGVSDPRLLPPYKFGTAVSLLVDIARKKKAWTSVVQARSAPIPKPGDFVLVGGDKERDGGVEHVFTVISANYDDKGNLYLWSIDGGQRDSKGNQAIFKKHRRWNMRDGSWWDVSSQGSDPGSNASAGRRVMGFGDIEKILGQGA